MDYKELIDKLRDSTDRWKQGAPLTLTEELRLQDALREAATAIETLLEERDDLRNQCCETCKFNRRTAVSCIECFFNGGCWYNWEWRGPQKEGG